MYARVTTLRYQPGKLEEGVQRARETVLPAVQQQQGFNSFVALQDPTTGKAMLITLFETEADAKAGAVSGGFVAQQASKIAAFVAEAPTVEFFEVAAQG
jgi:heme-degrading monooxygenase HmoA